MTNLRAAQNPVISVTQVDGAATSINRCRTQPIVATEGLDAVASGEAADYRRLNTEMTEQAQPHHGENSTRQTAWNFMLTRQECAERACSEAKSRPVMRNSGFTLPELVRFESPVAREKSPCKPVAYRGVRIAPKRPDLNPARFAHRFAKTEYKQLKSLAKVCRREER